MMYWHLLNAWILRQILTLWVLSVLAFMTWLAYWRTTSMRNDIWAWYQLRQIQKGR